jgi:glycosyltransferase involved in cell wall biosynthesis
MNRKVDGAQRPRVGIDLHTLEGIHQGSRTHCLEIFSRLPGMAPEMDFFFFADTGRWRPPAGLFQEDNVSVIHMEHTNPLRRLAVQLPGLVKKSQIDLLHTQYICPPLVGCSTAVTVHDILFEEFPQFFGSFFRFRSRLLVRRSVRQSPLIFTVSEYSRNEIARKYGISSDRIGVITNGVSADRFYPGDDGSEAVAKLGVRPGEYLLTVGRLEPRKNHARLIEAFSLLPAPRPKLLIVGQRDFGYQEMIELIRKLGVSEEVILQEKVDDHLLPAVYRNARLFLYPTLAEGFGMPVIEAMASGVPVITSNCTSLPEVAGDAAILADPASPSDLAKEIERVLDDADLSRRLSEKGVIRARDFNWTSPVLLLRDWYRSYFLEDAARN